VDLGAVARLEVGKCLKIELQRIRSPKT